MDCGIPLSALLSQLLVAFIIEADNEFEHRMPHRTTNHGSTSDSPHAPWLISITMWYSFLRYVPKDGISVSDLQRLLNRDRKFMQMWFDRLGKWWGYVVVDPPPTGRAKAPADAMVRLTSAGGMANGIWKSLPETIEKRWEKRFGREPVDLLRESLARIVDQLGPTLPGTLPILGYGLRNEIPDPEKRQAQTPSPIKDATLVALLSKVLLAFAIEYEEEARLALAIGANILRVIGEERVLVRDLPRLSGISKEAVATSLSFLEKSRFTITKPSSSGSRSKVVELSAKGQAALREYFQLVTGIEGRWQTRFGNPIVGNLRQVLEGLVVDPERLSAGIKLYPDNWRAAVPQPETLPHFPMVLHRGGFPDGS